MAAVPSVTVLIKFKYWLSQWRKRYKRAAWKRVLVIESIKNLKSIQTA